MKIALDVDEVLAWLMPKLNKYHNNTFGTNFKTEDHWSYDLDKVWGCTKPEAVRRVEEFFHSEYFAEIEPVDGAKEGIEYLSQRNELVAISSRPYFLQEKTEQFIGNNFGEKIREVVLTGQHASLAKNMTKLEACVSRGVDLIIEDCLEVAVKCANGGITAYLLDYRWNQTNGNNMNLPKNLIRVKNWKEIVGIIK